MQESSTTQKPTKTDSKRNARRMPITELRKASLEQSKNFSENELKQFSFGDFSEDTNSTKSPELKNLEQNQTFNFTTYKNQSFKDFHSLPSYDPKPRETRKFSLEKTPLSISEKLLIAQKNGLNLIEKEEKQPPKNIKLSQVFDESDIRDLFLNFCLSEL